MKYILEGILYIIIAIFYGIVQFVIVIWNFNTKNCESFEEFNIRVRESSDDYGPY